MKLRATLSILCLLFLLSSCQDDLDDNIYPADNLQINNFIWRAMNAYYLLKSNQPDLADDRFTNDDDYYNFLTSFNSPENFFNHLKVESDRFSVIVDDFRALENALDGIRLENGMKFGLVADNNSTAVFGYVRYVLPNSPADAAGIERGMLFNRIDGITLTEDLNLNELFGQDTYQIGFAEFQDDELISLDIEIELSKVEIQENPIHKVEVVELSGQKIGYLMYNAFTRSYDNELNTIFAQLQSEGIDELVLDLRYNSGGSIRTAQDLSSLITGQFEGDLFVNQLYNDNFDDQTLFFENVNSNGQNLNSLQLNRVFVLTTSTTASASELVISGLRPYIDVVQIGTNTSGKYQGSTTLYDSPNFRRQNANVNHSYALQPLILKIENSVGFTDYDEGLVPTFELGEDFANLGELGNPDENLFQKALEEMGVLGRTSGRIQKHLHYTLLGETQMNDVDYQRMYTD
ncbi:MAG: S41 family peptidase [Bacteroidota bacterium]